MLAERLVGELSLLNVRHDLGVDTQMARQDCHHVADETERASRRH